MKKIAFIYTWPNNPFKNAEYEFLKRREIAAKNIGQPLDIISSNGYILDDEYYETTQRVVENDYEFMVSVHYDDIKKLDIFSYYTLWVPPEISLQYSVYPQIKKNIISNDDFLIYDDGGQLNHLKTILLDSPRILDEHSELYATPPLSAVLKPNLKDPHLFYCGINWEKLIGAAPRHAELFKLLENEDWIDIFGPENTWKGCKRYKGKIPFDGISIIKEINKSGVALSISSNVHYRAASVTNRIYEAVAAGAVVISDTNPLVKKIFGDTVLYFDFDVEHPTHMFEQIKAHMQWIKKNKDKAQKMAEKAQEIFIKNLGLEQQLKAIINNHEKRKAAVASALYSRTNGKTLVLTFFDEKKWTKNSSERLKNILKNVERQIEKNIDLVIVSNISLKEELLKITSNYNYSIKTIFADFYDDFGNKIKTRGQALYEIINTYNHDFLMILHGTEYLFQDHITTLKRVLEDSTEDVCASYSGFLYEEKIGKFGYPKFEVLSEDYLLDIGRLYPNGTFLIRKDIESYLPEFVWSNIDGAELYALLNVAYFKYNRKFVFSKRMTAKEQKQINIFENPALPISYQTNMVNGINLFELEQKGKLKNVTPDWWEYKVRKILSKKIYRHIKFDIWLQKIRKLFAFSHKKKEKINSKIKKLKDARRKIKNTRNQ